MNGGTNQQTRVITVPPAEVGPLMEMIDISLGLQQSYRIVPVIVGTHENIYKCIKRHYQVVLAESRSTIQLRGRRGDKIMLNVIRLVSVCATVVANCIIQAPGIYITRPWQPSVAQLYRDRQIDGRARFHRVNRLQMHAHLNAIQPLLSVRYILSWLLQLRSIPAQWQRAGITVVEYIK